MNKITTTLEADADGTLHLPLPPELQRGKVRVSATLERAGSETPPDVDPQTQAQLKGFGSLKGKLWMAPEFDEPLEDFKEYME